MKGKHLSLMGLYFVRPMKPMPEIKAPDPIDDYQNMGFKNDPFVDWVA